MTLDDIPLFATLKNRMGYLGDRQQVIAQNVANADTPGFTPSDMKPFTLPGRTGSLPPLAPIAPAMTSPMHMAGTATPPKMTAKPVSSPDSETKLDGNSVVLEEEMMRMSQARMDYDTAVTFYQKATAMIQQAAKRPGT
jgi:flagellar basal-body rod protein FlgB